MFPTQPGQRPVTTCVYKPEAANTVWSSWWWAVCRSKHVEPPINFGIINSITRLHLVGYFYWFYISKLRPTFLNYVRETVTARWQHHVVLLWCSTIGMPMTVNTEQLLHDGSAPVYTYHDRTAWHCGVFVGKRYGSKGYPQIKAAHVQWI